MGDKGKGKRRVEGGRGVGGGEVRRDEWREGEVGGLRGEGRGRSGRGGGGGGMEKDIERVYVRYM